MGEPGLRSPSAHKEKDNFENIDLSTLYVLGFYSLEASISYLVCSAGANV
jgi:hypothetical protein